MAFQDGDTIAIATVVKCWGAYMPRRMAYGRRIELEGVGIPVYQEVRDRRIPV